MTTEDTGKPTPDRDTGTLSPQRTRRFTKGILRVCHPEGNESPGVPGLEMVFSFRFFNCEL
jgi:hypothetical protein